MSMPNVSTEKKESKSLFYLDTRSNLTSLQFNFMPSISMWPLEYSLMIWSEPPLSSTEPLYLMERRGLTMDADSNSLVCYSKEDSMYNSNSLISFSWITYSPLLLLPNQPFLDRYFWSSSTLLSKMMIFITLWVHTKSVSYSTYRIISFNWFFSSSSSTS